MSYASQPSLSREASAVAAQYNSDEQDQVDRALGKLRAMGGDPTRTRIAKSPLRISPLGAHIDHQLGVVTGMTIDRSVLLAFAPSDGPDVRMESLNFPGTVAFRVDEVPPPQRGAWANYVRGAAKSLRQLHGIRQGIVGVIGGAMPIGGLSSSAAVTTAYLLALEDVNGLGLTPYENVELSRITENDYIGLNNGILDQTVILFGEKGHLTRIDCESVAIERLPFPHRESSSPAFKILVVYSGVSDALTGTDYNNRVAECQEAARRLMDADGQEGPHDVRLRHVRPEAFDMYGHTLPEGPYRRARHYFGEMARVAAGEEAWMKGDMVEFGRLVNESGESSVRWYESGSPQLTTLYETLRDTSGVFGTRFSGAGFRGSCIAIVEPGACDQIAEAVHAVYSAKHPQEANRYSVHICEPDSSARLLESPNNRVW